MRNAAKIDDNQRQIVAALRRAGCTVQSLAAIGKGCPDLLVGLCGVNLLVEVKDPAKVPSKQQLTADQVAWHDKWDGQVAIVRTLEDAGRLVMAARQQQNNPPAWQYQGDRDPTSPF